MPFDRTYSSAPPGELCDAVGRCPACPHGEPDLSSIHSLALTLALRKAVIIEIEKGEPALIGKWGPVLDRLDVVWLPAFALDLRDVPLPPVPSLTGCLV